MIKRILVCVLLAAMIIGGLNVLTAAPKKYTLMTRFVMDTQLKLVKELVDEFNKKNPSTQFEVTAVAPDKQEQIIFTQFQAGNPPDVIHMTQASIGVLNERGLLANLAPYYRMYKWNQRVPKGQIDFFTGSNGQIPVVPFEGGVYTFLHYNADLFTRLGIAKPSRDVPMSWDAFLKMCDKIKAAGIAPMTLGNRDQWTLQHLISFYTQEACTVKDAQALWTKPGSPKITDPRPLAGLKKLWYLLKNGYFASGVNAMTDDEARMLLYSDKAAMYHIGEWWPYMITGDKMVGKFNADFLPIPALESDVPYKMMGSAHGFTVPKTTSVRVAAKLIDWMTSVPNMQKQAATGVAATIIGAKTADNTDAMTLAYAGLYKYTVVNTEPNQELLNQIRSIGQALVDAKTEQDVLAIAQKLQKAKDEVLGNK